MVYVFFLAFLWNVWHYFYGLLFAVQTTSVFYRPLYIVHHNYRYTTVSSQIVFSPVIGRKSTHEYVYVHTSLVKPNIVSPTQHLRHILAIKKRTQKLLHLPFIPSSSLGPSISIRICKLNTSYSNDGIFWRIRIDPYPSIHTNRGF